MSTGKPHSNIDLVKAARMYYERFRDRGKDRYLTDMVKLGHSEGDARVAWAKVAGERRGEADEPRGTIAASSPSPDDTSQRGQAVSQGATTVSGTCLSTPRRVTTWARPYISWLKNRPLALPMLIAATMAFVAVGDLPYEYYTLVRVVVCATSAYGVVASAVHRRMWAPWPCSVIAVLFNPFVPVELSKEYWQTLDVLAGILLLATGALVRSRTRR